MKSVGALVRERREFLRISLTDLAKEVGTSKVYLSEVETGKKVFSAYRLTQVEEVLAIDLHDTWFAEVVQRGKERYGR